ncbi:DUF5011 domain-containing protein, partial [Enterococcus faecalis]|nr:DUF5011 domain-containing protein [Enterococcus faecalis]
GQIYTETTIDSETLDQMSANKKKVTTAPITLKFSEGDAEGIVYLATATFYTHNIEDENQAIAKVSFELIDNVTHTATEFTTDEKGQYSFDAIMTGDYTLRVTNVPQEYSVDEEYLTGKAIKLVKGDNQLKIPLTKTIDHSRLQVKDTTIYVGDSWKPEENFVSATDKTGQDVPFEKITVSGQVDTSKAGVYPIVYSYEGKEETAHVTVKPDQSKLEVKDSTIYVGDKWKPEDNFVSATDKTGQDVPFEKIDVQGTVNVDKIGDYKIVYKNGTKEAKAIVHVRDDSRLQVKDSTIYVGDSWKPEENFVSATDKTGQDVPFEKITVSGQVDNTKAGIYPIIYSYEGKEETAHVTVKADQSKLEVKDTTIYVGDKWEAEDNFVSATDKTGQDVPFEKIDVQGTVNVDKIGDYEIVYKNGTKEAKAIVHVRDDSRLQVKDSTIYVGDSWEPEENFVSATDKTGQDVPFEKITVSGQVDTSKAGVYPIVYSYEGKEETAHVTVKPDQSKLEVKDTTIYVGDSWKPEDNFVSATDRDGHAISFDKVQVKGEVDTKKTGEYQISYTTEPVNETKPAVQSRLFAMFSNETPRQLTTVATVHVIDRNPTPLPDKNENNQTSSSTNQTTIKRSQYVTHIVKPDKQGRYPKTGEQTNGLYRVLGLVVLLIVIISGIVIKKKRK